MNDETRKFLTEEVLGECWHEPEWRCCDCGRQFTPNKSSLIEVPICAYCGSPNKDFALPDEDNRTFTTEADMMDLYAALWKAGKWDAFYARMTGKFIVAKQNCYLPHCELAIWLFCLSGDGYEERCQMVADFLKGGEK